MNKNVVLPVDIALLNHPEQNVLAVSLSREALHEWCLGLCLLKECLIETLIVTGERRKTSVRIRLGPEPEKISTARATLAPDTNLLEIANNDLDRLRYFFLRYYRDGVADVDHLDLEAIDANTGKKDIYITFKVPDSKPPVSPAEAGRRLLGRG
jgi:hypothetical protein